MATSTEIASVPRRPPRKLLRYVKSWSSKRRKQRQRFTEKTSGWPHLRERVGFSGALSRDFPGQGFFGFESFAETGNPSSDSGPKNISAIRMTRFSNHKIFFVTPVTNRRRKSLSMYGIFRSAPRSPVIAPSAKIAPLYFHTLTHVNVV